MGFKLVYIDEDDEWALYDDKERKYYDIDLSDYQKNAITKWFENKCCGTKACKMPANKNPNSK